MSSSSVALNNSGSLPSAKKHKRSSSGDLSANELDSLAVALKTIANKIKEVQAQHQWGDLEELEHLAEETDTVIRQVKAFQNIKKKDDNAVIVSLSNMDRKILSERLGIQEIKIIHADVDSEIFLKELTAAIEIQPESRHLDTIKYIVDGWEPTFLSAALSTIEETVNKKSEAASRIIIDVWLLQGMQLIQRMQETYTPILFPELLIWSRNSETDDPPTIKHNDQVTHLAGITDYGLLSILPPDESYPERNMAKGLLHKENAARALRFFTTYDILNVYEAKRASKSLEVHEPQVIAQCLAIIAKLNASTIKPPSQNLAFTLTSGEVWVFGVVDAKNKECFRTTEVRLNIRTMSDSSLRALMTLILIWSTQSGDVIKAAMRSLK